MAAKKTPATETDIEISRRITVKTVTGMNKADIRKLAETGNGKPVPIMHVYGRASGFGTMDKGDFGPSNFITGDIEAVDAVNGTIKQGMRAYFPDWGATELLIATIKTAEGGVVEFGFTFSVVYDPNAATEYVYQAKPLKQVQKHDPMAELREKLRGVIPGLPAPASNLKAIEAPKVEAKKSA